MNKSALGIIIISILVLASLTFLYTSNDGKLDNNSSSSLNKNSKNQTTYKNHYENESVTFNYPNGWKISKEKVKAPEIVTVAKDKDNLCSVFKEKLGDTSLTDRLNEWRSNIGAKGKIYYEGTITIDGRKAYDIQSTYSIGEQSYSSRGIGFEKNGVVYFIIFVFKGALIDHKSDMDVIINSFHVKENKQFGGR